MPTIQDDLKSLALRVPTGATIYFDCPWCGKLKKLGMSHKPQGVIYQCFSSSCPLSGIIPNEGMPISKMKLNSILKGITAKPVPFSIPDHWIDGFASEASIKMATKYSLLDGYAHKQFKTAYDPKLYRQVFYYTNKEGKIIGANGRALGYGVKPKSYIYPNSLKTPWIVGKEKVGVVVEDTFSAVKCYNVGYTGISLSGTSVSAGYLEYLRGYDKLIIALDKDATIKSLEAKKLLDFVCRNVVVLPLQKDIKDMTDIEATKLIKNVA